MGDTAGRLLRKGIIHGTLPLWDARGFSSLFMRFQESTWLCRRRPSRCAESLIRDLLTPRRQERLTAPEALKHVWFTMPTADTDEQWTPLLKWDDFEDSFSRMEKDLKEGSILMHEV